MLHRPARAVIATFAVSSLLVLGAVAPATASRGAALTPAALKDYANCTKMNKDYPHGVGRLYATDKVSGNTPKVRNFYRNNALYRLNKESDRDGDKIACEKL